MNRQQIMDLLNKSEAERKAYVLTNNISLSEFCNNIEDMKLSSLMGPNDNRILFNKLSILKTEIISIIYQIRNEQTSKPCSESKFRMLMQTMFL